MTLNLKLPPIERRGGLQGSSHLLASKLVSEGSLSCSLGVEPAIWCQAGDFHRRLPEIFASQRDEARCRFKKVTLLRLERQVKASSH